MRSVTPTTLLNYLVLLYAASIPFSLDLIRIFAPLIILVWFTEGDLKNKWEMIRHEPLFQAFGILLLVLTISLLWTEPDNLKTGIKYITRYWYVLPMFAIYTSLKKTFIPYTLYAFLGGMTISVIGSYLVYFHIISFKYYALEGASPFMHHTLYSIFLAFSIGLLLKYILMTHSYRYKLLYGLLFLGFTVNLFLNIGRAGHLLFFIITPLVLITHFKITWRSVIITLLSLLMVLWLAYTQSSNFKAKVLQTQQNLGHISYNTSLGARIGLNIVAKDIFMIHPLIGVGIGDYLSEKSHIIDTRYPDRKYVRFLVHYHNQYAEFAVIAGIFGLFSYLFLLISLNNIPIEDSRLRTLKYILAAVFFLSSFIDAMFHLNRPLSLFALFVGILLASARTDNHTKTAS